LGRIIALRRFFAMQHFVSARRCLHQAGTIKPAWKRL